MNNLKNISELYKSSQKKVSSNKIDNDFINMMLNDNSTTNNVLDKLAYLAGIKNAPADDKYLKLNTSSLSSLLESAKVLGYDIEVVSV